MHILHFKMSISASKFAIIISNIHLLMYCWNKLQHMQHKNWVFFFNVIKYDTSHLWQLIGAGLLKENLIELFRVSSLAGIVLLAVLLERGMFYKLLTY